MPVKVDKPEPQDKEQLRKLNVAYTECIANTFWPDFSAGKPININDYCVDLRKQMLTLDRKIYPNDAFQRF